MHKAEPYATELVAPEGVQGVGSGTAAGGAGHGQQGGGGEQQGGASVEEGVAGIQAERGAAHVLAQGGRLGDGEPQADEEAAHHGAAATDEDFLDDVGAGGAEGEAYAEIAGALVDGEVDGAVDSGGGEHGGDEAEEDDERDDVPQHLGDLIDPALQDIGR